MQQHPVVHAGSISGWKVPVYMECGTLLFLLELALRGVAGDTLKWPEGWPEHLDRAPDCYPSEEKQRVVLTGFSGP